MHNIGNFVVIRVFSHLSAYCKGLSGQGGSETFIFAIGYFVYAYSTCGLCNNTGIYQVIFMKSITYYSVHAHVYFMFCFMAEHVDIQNGDRS